MKPKLVDATFFSDDEHSPTVIGEALGEVNNVRLIPLGEGMVMRGVKDHPDPAYLGRGVLRSTPWQGTYPDEGTATCAGIRRC